MQTEIVAHFQRTEFRDVVVLAGFGRFGQSVLASLQALAADKFGRVVIMDLHASSRVAVFAQQVGFKDFYERQIIDGDLSDPRTWHRITGLDAHEPVFVLGCGDDSVNLHTALWVKRAHPRAYVVARTFHRSSFADDLGREGGFMVFSVATLVARSVPRAWFVPK